MAAAASQGSTWKPHDKLTIAPTNLKEAIDWVLRVTGRDGKKNDKAAASPPQLGCLCYLAKAVKDLLYDAKSPGSPGPHPDRYWDDILLPEEQSIVKPVLTDLGLLNGESTSAARDTCAGGTEVIKALIDQLALGLQKWVGWEEGDTCCLGQKNGTIGQNESKGIGGKCPICGYTVKSIPCSCQCCSTCRPGASTSGGRCGSCTAGTNNIQCCKPDECRCCHCAIKPEDCHQSGCYCYISAYKRPNGAANPPENYLWPTVSNDSTKVHLLARIFLGSVCLIWSGLSHLGFLTGGSERWKDGDLSKESSNLGSFMAAMGYDLDRLNGRGDFVWKLLSGEQTSDEKNRIKWQEFASVKDKLGDSVAEYYSSIYEKAKSAVKSTTEKICEQYPLLVLHILASGYFRAGSAGAKGITSPAPKAPQPAEKKDTPSSRKPRSIREILYWLSALPYSKGYRALVGRMGQKYPRKEGEPDKTEDTIVLHGEKSASTTLKKDCISHYLMAACGYCPLVLIGIQGTIEKEVTQSQSPSPAGKADENKCNKKYDENKDCDKDKVLTKNGQVCYRGYHLEVKDFGPLHGMYANGLFGFQMDLSAAQCLDQLRIYVYHCFYQLYFLRKQCGAGVTGDKKAVLGWKSCRYGKDVKLSSSPWLCSASSKVGAGQSKCNCHSSTYSPLMSFLCDGLKDMRCKTTIARSNSKTNPYPPIEDHLEAKKDIGPGHLGEPPIHCPVPMGWSKESKDGHFKDLNTGSHKKAELTTGKDQKYPAHCTGRTLSHLLEYYCDPGVSQQGTLVVLLRLLACITPTVPRTLGDLFGFYYYIVYIGGFRSWLSKGEVKNALEVTLEQYGIGMLKKDSTDGVLKALECYGGVTSASKGTQNNDGSLMRLYSNYSGPYLSPLSGQQYGQLSPAMAGTYLSWLVYLIEGFQGGLDKLKEEFKKVDCKDSECHKGGNSNGCDARCTKGHHGDTCNTSGGGSNGVCQCTSVVSCTGVLPVLYKYGFGYGNVTDLHKGPKKCDAFLTTLNKVLGGAHLKNGSQSGLHHEINQLIYTTRLPWIFVLTLAWLVAVLYLAFGAIWPLDWTHMRSHCRGWFRKGSLSPWEVLMVGKKKGRGILEYFN